MHREPALPRWSPCVLPHVMTQKKEARRPPFLCFDSLESVGLDELQRAWSAIGDHHEAVDTRFCA